MNPKPTSDSLLPLPNTRGDRTMALELRRADGLYQADSGVNALTPASGGSRAPSSSPDLMSTAILDQVFADMV